VSPGDPGVSGTPLIRHTATAPPASESEPRVPSSGSSKDRIENHKPKFPITKYAFAYRGGTHAWCRPFFLCAKQTDVLERAKLPPLQHASASAPIVRERGVLLRSHRAVLRARGAMLGAHGVVLGPCGAMLRACGVALRPCGAVLRARGVALRPGGAVLCACGVVLRPCGAVLRARGVLRMSGRAVERNVLAKNLSKSTVGFRQNASLKTNPIKGTMVRRWCRSGNAP
jgi:hypothetical protein